jgi:hypothetical protein
MMRLRGILVCMIVLCANGCAVHWSMRPEQSSFKKVYIPLPDNTSMSAGVDMEYYLALRDKITADPQLVLVETKAHSDQVLLIKLIASDLKRGPTSFTGTEETQVLGGLAKGAYTAASLRLAVQLEFESRSPLDASVDWVREYEKEIQFEAANRLLESEGASSLSAINESRVQIFHKQIAGDFARVVVDQLVEDF